MLTTLAMRLLASLVSTLPCTDAGPLLGIDFEAFREIELRSLDVAYNGVYAIAETRSGECFAVRFIDQSIHTAIFGERGITFNEPMRIAFCDPIWRIVAYIGSDTSDPERLPCMWCYREGWPFPVGADCAGTTVAPEAWIGTPAAASSDRAFQYFVYFVSPWAFLNYTPAPIAWCDFEPNGSDLFIGLVMIDPTDPRQAVAAMAANGGWPSFAVCTTGPTRPEGIVDSCLILYDLNGDARIDLRDFAILQQHREIIESMQTNVSAEAGSVLLEAQSDSPTIQPQARLPPRNTIKRRSTIEQKPPRRRR